MYCGVEMKPDIASPNDRFGASDLENPRGAMPVFWGEYYCSKCRHSNCGVSIPLSEKDIENLKRWFSHNPERINQCIPEIQSRFKL